MWREPWLWMVLGLGLALAEMLLPGFYLLGFAVGAVATGALDVADEKNDAKEPCDHGGAPVRLQHQLVAHRVGRQDVPRVLRVGLELAP